MIVLNKAILHILDFPSGTMLYSDSELSLDDNIKDFLCNHISRSWEHQDLKPGQFRSDSEAGRILQSYGQGEIDFVGMSKKMGRLLGQALERAEEVPLIDFLLCDVALDEQEIVVMLECNGHKSFMQQSQSTDKGIFNSIVAGCSVLPGQTQKIDEIAFWRKKDNTIRLCEKQYRIEGTKAYLFSEGFLACNTDMSVKEKLRQMNKVVRKAAADYGLDDVKVAAAAKSCMCSQLEKNGEISPLQAVREVFSDNSSACTECGSQIQAAGLNEPIIVHDERVAHKIFSHKIKTDTGIELTIPSNYFDDTDYLEFVKNIDGSMSITLKGIQNITNKG